MNSNVKKIRSYEMNACVAFAQHNGTYYYAINSSKENDKKIKSKIRSVLGKNSKQCETYYSFTILPIINDYKLPHESYHKNSYHLIEDQIHDAVRNGLPIKQPYPLSELLRYYENKRDLPHNFSCAERKVIGRIASETYFNIDLVNEFIYTIWRPCYFCIPALNKVAYYDDVVHKVKKAEITRDYIHKSVEIKPI